MILNGVVVGFLGESVADSGSASNETNEEVREVTSRSAIVFLEKLKACQCALNLIRILENSLSPCVLRFVFRVVFPDDACCERD
jgi:hypothetical protein